MDRTGIAERAERIDAVCSDPGADASSVEAALVAARELTGWVEARRGVLVAKLVERSSFPEAAIATADRTSIAAAHKARERAETLDATPRLAEVLGEGATTAGHIDAVTRAARKLPVARRGELLDRRGCVGRRRGSVDGGTVREAGGARSTADRVRRRHGSSRASAAGDPFAVVGRRRRDVERPRPVRSGDRRSSRREAARNGGGAVRRVDAAGVSGRCDREAAVPRGTCTDPIARRCRRFQAGAERSIWW